MCGQLDGLQIHPIGVSTVAAHPLLLLLLSATSSHVQYRVHRSVLVISQHQSIYSIALDNKATGFTKFYNADVASYAKKDLKAGEKLDGEGGFCARGRLITSKASKSEKILPLGLTDNAVLKREINKDEVIKLDDVELNLPAEVIEARDYQYNLI